MQIRVRCNCGEGTCQEWAIVELQGVIEPQPGFQDSLQNLQIGTLCRSSSQEVYTFTIGYHELTGSKVPLKKPMVVLKKVKQCSSDDGGESNGCEVELQVVGIIRHRILFKTRPKALISSKIYAYMCAPFWNWNMFLVGIGMCFVFFLFTFVFRTVVKQHITHQQKLCQYICKFIACVLLLGRFLGASSCNMKFLSGHRARKKTKKFLLYLFHILIF